MSIRPRGASNVTACRNAVLLRAQAATMAWAALCMPVTDHDIRACHRRTGSSVWLRRGGQAEDHAASANLRRRDRLGDSASIGPARICCSVTTRRRRRSRSTALRPAGALLRAVWMVRSGRHAGYGPQDHLAEQRPGMIVARILVARKQRREPHCSLRSAATSQMTKKSATVRPRPGSSRAICCRAVAPEPSES